MSFGIQIHFVELEISEISKSHYKGFTRLFTRIWI